MSGGPNILVLADEPRSGELAKLVGPDRCVLHADPYDALVAMGRRPWSAVLLTAPQPDFPSLCKAARRLQAEARIFALCGPAGEAEARPLVGDVLDDYFIYPPVQADISRLREGTLVKPPARGPRGLGPPGGLPERQDVQGSKVIEKGEGISPSDLARLVDASSSVRSLEAHVADMVGRYVSAPLEWLDAAGAHERAEPLLTLDVGQVRRVLVPADGQVLPEPPTGLLSALEGCLPSLVTSVTRTESLRRLAVIDHLTGAYNRRYFYQLTDRILLQAGRRNLRASLLLFDIDDFKHYNDTYGHASGDEILKEIAALMKDVTRSHDIVARIGGDEFAMLFWDEGQPRTPGSKTPENAFILADRFRKAVQNHAFPSLGPEATGILTISGGLATFGRDGRTCRELLRKADEALRTSKQTGKNSITLIGAT